MNTIEITATTTLDELNAKVLAAKAELEAAQEAARQAEREANEAKEEAERKLREAQREAERKAAVEKRMVHANAMIAALHTVGVKSARIVESATNYPKIKILEGDVYDNDCALTFETAYSDRGSWRYREVGYKIEVGTYGNSKHYPMKKDGTFNYDKIAFEIKERIDVRAAQIKRDKERKSNEAQSAVMVEELRAKYGIDKWAHRVNVHANVHDGERVNFRIDVNKSMTKEEADKALEALKALGLMD